MNIIAIWANNISSALASKYGLVPDTHTERTHWYKIVVMDHVEIDYLQKFIKELP